MTVGAGGVVQDSDSARVTAAEIVTPCSCACSRTRAASEAGSLTVNTTFASGTSIGPVWAASTYRRPCRTDTENRCATTPAASIGAIPVASSPAAALIRSARPTSSTRLRAMT